MRRRDKITNEYMSADLKIGKFWVDSTQDSLDLKSSQGAFRIGGGDSPKSQKLDLS